MLAFLDRFTRQPADPRNLALYRGKTCLHAAVVSDIKKNSLSPEQMATLTAHRAMVKAEFRTYKPPHNLILATRSITILADHGIPLTALKTYDEEGLVEALAWALTLLSRRSRPSQRHL